MILFSETESVTVTESESESEGPHRKLDSVCSVPFENSMGTGRPSPVVRYPSSVTGNLSGRLGIIEPDQL